MAKLLTILIVANLLFIVHSINDNSTIQVNSTAASSNLDPLSRFGWNETCHLHVECWAEQVLEDDRTICQTRGLQNKQVLTWMDNFSELVINMSVTRLGFTEHFDTCYMATFYFEYRYEKCYTTYAFRNWTIFTPWKNLKFALFYGWKNAIGLWPEPKVIISLIRWFRIWFLPIIILMAVLNSAILFQMLSKESKGALYYHLGEVVTDILVYLAGVGKINDLFFPVHAMFMYNLSSNEICTNWSLIFFSNIFNQSFLFFLALERCVAVVYPMKYKYANTKKLAILVIILSLFVSFLVGYSSCWIFNISVPYDVYDPTHLQIIHKYLSAIMIFTLPLGIMLQLSLIAGQFVCGLIILRKMWTSPRSKGMQQSDLLEKIMLLLGTVGLNLILQMPLLYTSIWQIINKFQYPIITWWNLPCWAFHELMPGLNGTLGIGIHIIFTTSYKKAAAQILHKYCPCMSLIWYYIGLTEANILQKAQPSVQTKVNNVGLAALKNV